MLKIFVIDDNREWLDYYERLLGGDNSLVLFRNGVEAMEGMGEDAPDLIILDILLTGPTGFALLNEMQSYTDLAEVPIIIVSSVAIKEDLSEYGVVKIFDKGEMTPRELMEEVEKWTA